MSTNKTFQVRASLQVETREKRQVDIDAAEGIKNLRIYSYNLGTFITVYGAYDCKEVLHAEYSEGEESTQRLAGR